MTVGYLDEHNEVQILRNVSLFNVEGDDLCVNYFGDTRNYIVPFKKLLSAMDSEEIKHPTK
jgi:hypothetical protein